MATERFKRLEVSDGDVIESAWVSNVKKTLEMTKNEAPTWARLRRLNAAPWISTPPVSGVISPRAMLKAVDLPAPLRPSSP